MKKFRLILGVLALMSLTTVYGQQDPQYTQYMYNMNILNPAYAGSKGVPSIGILGRTQWVGVEGAPQTFTLAAHAPIGRAVGLGLSVIHDEIGPVKEDNIYADFSYTIFTSSTGRLAFGLKAGVTFMDVRELLMIDPDPLNIPVHETSPNFGAGVYYYTDKFYAGLSVPNFLETRHLEKDGGIVSTASEKMHYFLTSGYVFDIADNLKLKPSTMIKATEGAPLSVDLSLNLLIDERVELGLSHRFDDSISGMIGFQVNNDFRLGYAYDHTITKFGDFNSGSHEILLLFDFNRKNVKSPRFF
ncbi:type IX secretion system membrane protein PorP/SprF [Lutibacter sp. A80]|uniref:PorP/SprF family type IX secretion system membrane protein n=1 Tax=Lutibacter sp. A80 TaxID=2918453 RepID=UPI001F05E0CC|nr:type IX secretion system membrane protein PorP/SprF [Lutibacter sp. A80]UMB59401.1 type IX secretion system membrane protein PorP/SprF [Lutibacter sp. A80]UMB59998.1 type IX secretion system membrane protein PorP/SprF [Lutibacter sp. A80]